VADPFRDRGPEAEGVFVRQLQARLAELVTTEVVEEHRLAPVGHHSPALSHVLAYTRQRPTEGKLAILATTPGYEWVVLRLSGEPGVPHQLLEDMRFPHEAESLHALVLRRLSELGLEVEHP
jgi:branched-chain amino acid transport system permease protein